MARLVILANDRQRATIATHTQQRANVVLAINIWLLDNMPEGDLRRSRPRTGADHQKPVPDGARLRGDLSGADDQPGGQPIRDPKPLFEVAQRQTITADQPLYKGQALVRLPA